MRKATIRRKTALVLNKEAAGELTHFTTNLSFAGVKIRKETLLGREYVVVPVVMLNEGVHAGTHGPLLYPAQELQESVDHWNHRPVVVYHSEIDGRGVSACSPEILNKQQIGLTMNTRFGSDKRLVTEAWIEEALAKKVDNRVWDAIQKKEALEQSTGLFTSNEASEGTFNGDKYIAIARNHRPDHLAVLPDVKGAFSLERGGGFIRNELHALNPLLDPKAAEAARALIINALSRQLKRGKPSPVLQALVANEISHEELRQAIAEALEEQYPPPNGDEPGYMYPYVESVYNDKFIFHLGGKMYVQQYTEAFDGGIKLSGSPTEVVRFAEYRTTGGESVVNAASSPTNNEKGNTTMNKKEIVDDLIANHGHAEESRALLMGLDEKALKAIHGAATVTANKAKAATPEPVLNAAAKAYADMTPDEQKAWKKKNPGKAPPTANQAETVEEEPPTAEQYIANAPPAIRDMLNSGLSAHNTEKAGLIAKLVANKANQFTKPELEEMSLSQLRRIAVLAAVPTTSQQSETVQNRFDGLAPVAVLTANEKLEDQALVMPTLSWEKK